MSKGLSKQERPPVTSTIAAVVPLRRERISLDLIDIAPDRLRRLDPAWAEIIGLSMVEAGQYQNIGLVAKPDGRFALKFGLHRVHGAYAAGMVDLDAAIWGPDEAGARDEIFENLIRAPLTALDRAIYLSELKSVHERLHPQTRNGAQGGRGAQRNESEIFAFSKIAAERTGLSRRSIELAVQIVKGLPAGIVDRLRGSTLARNQGALITLAGQSSNLQGRILDILLAPVETRLTDQIGEAILLAQGRKLPTPADRLWRTVNDKVARLKPAVRQQLFETYESEIRQLARAKGWL